MKLLISSGAEKITEARSPIIPAATIAGAPFAVRLSHISFMSARLDRLTEWNHVDKSRHMNEKTAIAALAALAQPTRLQVFRRLVNCYPDELAAGEIARLCKTPHNTMSTHLAIMAHASLVSVRKEGRMMHYQADISGFQKLMNFLLQDCCKGRAEICAPLAAELSCGVPAPKRRKNSNV